MLSRELVKIISSSRISIFRKALSNHRINPRPCSCSFYRPTYRPFCTVVERESEKPCQETQKANLNPIGTLESEEIYKNEEEEVEEGVDKESQETQETPESIRVPGIFTTEHDVLEKFIAGISSDIFLKKRVYKNDLNRVLSNIKTFNLSSKKQGLLLLHCCTNLLVDETPAARMALAAQVWNTLEPHTNFEVDHYNELLRVHIANKVGVVAYNFLMKMHPVEANLTTYELLIECLSEVGDLNQATEVLTNMKVKGFPATESIFNSLMVCQGRTGQVNKIEDIVTMMDSLKFDLSADSYVALARAYAYSKKFDTVLAKMEEAVSAGIEFEESHIMEIVKTIAECNVHDLVPKILEFLPEATLSTPSISATMQAATTELVFQNHPMVALEIYRCLPLPSFGPRDDQGLHGRSLIRDCVKASTPTSLIGLIAQELMASGRNPIAIHNAAEAALQLGKTPLALDLFGRMKQLGMPLRQHYFWPILLQSSKSYGEKGIMNTLKIMISMGVPPDYETVKEYVLPYVSFTSPQNLMKKFRENGVNTSIVLTPMMELLLNTGQVRAASEICEIFRAKIDAEKLLKPLMKGHLISMNTVHTVHILKDIAELATEKHRDWLGRFFCSYIKQKRTKESLIDMKIIMKEIKKTNLKISASAADFCVSQLDGKFTPEEIQEFKALLTDITDETLIDEGEMFTHSMPHPKHMNEESLRAHLIELEAKGLNTRGVLRKLLQEYVRVGNLPAAKEVVKKCQEDGIFLSAGMQASIFDLQVKLGDLEAAEMTLAELNKSSPNFALDEYKVIDFATLMVYRKRIDKAFDLISEESKKRNVIGGRNISMNCWRLLDAVAANNSHVETRNMFEMLTSLKYCKPTNVILGPLIRAHLKNESLEEAVNEFVRLAEKYRKTPLKHELLCRILAAMGEGGSEEKFLEAEKYKRGVNNKMVQRILNINKQIHGPADVQISMIAALADVGYKKSLRKMFLDPSVKIHPDALMRQCERFAQEGKIDTLETIVEAAKDLRHLDITEIYDLMLDVHQRADDVDSAIDLWRTMLENDVAPTQKFLQTLCAMAKANNKEVPAEVVALLDKRKVQNPIKPKVDRKKGR